MTERSHGPPVAGLAAIPGMRAKRPVAAMAGAMMTGVTTGEEHGDAERGRRNCRRNCRAAASG